MQCEKKQQKVKKVTKKLGLANTPELCCLDLTSEVGEFTKEVLELTDYGKYEIREKQREVNKKEIKVKFEPISK